MCAGFDTPCSLGGSQAAHDQVVRLNRVCGAAFPVPRQFVGGVPWEGGVDGVAGDGSGGGDTRDGGGFAGEGSGIIPPEVRRIGPEELDFGGKVRYGRRLFPGSIVLFLSFRNT